MNSEFSELTKKAVEFRDKRNWQQFHNSKDLAIALSIEASELTELFLWKRPEDVDAIRLKEELADVLIYSILLAYNHGIDIPSIIKSKIRKNGKKYPVRKSKGRATKYDKL